jgi:HEAT repeat protein
MKLLSDAEVRQVRFLKNKDARVRSAAARNLAWLGSEAKFAILPLRQRLRDVDPQVRCQAAMALGEIGSAAVEELIQALSLSDINVRREAVWALGKIGPGAGSAAKALAKALSDRDSAVRKGAARALGMLGRQARPAIPFLIRALQDTDLLFCRLAAWALGKIGSPAVGALVRALSHADKYVQREAAWALSQIGPEARAAIPKLVAILQFSSGDGTFDQIKKNPADQDTEVMFVCPGPDTTLRFCAAQALGKMGHEARSAIPALRAALADPNDQVAQAAAQALNQLQEETGSGWYLQAAG